MALSDAIGEIQELIGALTGIRTAPDTPDESVVFPAALTYLARGTFQNGPPEVMTGLHDIAIEIHVARGGSLARAVAECMPYAESVPDALWGALRDGTITELQTWGSIDYVFGPAVWGGVPTVAFTFTMRGAKTQEAIT